MSVCQRANYADCLQSFGLGSKGGAFSLILLLIVQTDATHIHTQEEVTLQTAVAAFLPSFWRRTPSACFSVCFRQ